MCLKSIIASLLVLLPLSVAADYRTEETKTTKALSTVCNSIGTNGEPTCSSITVETNVEQSETWSAFGNPINVLTGNKFERATDIQISGGEYALSLNRYYNSRSTQRGLLGIGWRHDYEMQLQDTNDQINILQADGRKIDFVKTAAALDNSTLFVTRYAASKPELGYLERTQSADPSKAAWIWTLPTGKQFEFVVHKQTSITNIQGLQRFGQLSRVIERPSDPNSPYWSLTYGTDGKLAQVDNHLGDRLKFGYHTTKSGLPRITITSSTPNKNKSTNSAQSATWHYLLDQNNNLAQVVSPTGDRTGYRYTDPNDKHNLTAKYRYDDKGAAQLITEWTYDAYDRAISSSHDNGVEKVSVAFDPDTIIPMPANHIFTNTITNSVGETTDYRYRFIEGDVQLISVRGAGCATCGPTNISYKYDSAGRVIKTSQLDDKGQIISSTAKEFDSLGRTIKVIQTNEQNEQTWLTYRYDNESYPMQPTVISRPSVVDGKTAQTTLTYDESGNVTSMTEMGFRPLIPDTDQSISTSIERTTTFHYSKINGRHVVTAIDSPHATIDKNINKGAIAQTQYSWDALGENITEIRYPEGLVERFAYQTVAGQRLLTEHTAPDGVTTILSYNDEGLPITMQRGAQQLSIGYDDRLRPIKWTNQLQQTIGAIYDDSKQQVTYQLYDGQKVVNQYDTENQLVNRQWLDEMGEVLLDPLALQHDDMLISEQNSSNKAAAAKLIPTAKNNSAMNVVSDNHSPKSGRKEEITGAVFNPTDRLLNANAVIEIETNPLGKIEQITLPEGATYERIYDDFGRIIYAKDANTGSSTVEYDLNDQPILIQSASSKQMASYDDSGRLITTEYCLLAKGNTISTEQNCENIIYTYDGAQLSQITDPTQTTLYSYDTQGRLTIETVQFKNSDKLWQTQYKYDDKGRIDKVSLPEDATLTYVYSNINNPVEVKYQRPIQGWFEKLIRKVNPDYNSIALISNIESDSVRGLLSFNHSNGHTVKADYDKAGRMTTWTDGNYQKKLTYDRANQITAIHSLQDNKGSHQQFEYNAYGELTNVIDADKNQNTQYHYDLNANRLSSNSTEVQAQYEYKAGTDQLLSINKKVKHTSNANNHDSEQDVTYNYDPDGNPTLIKTQNKDIQTQRQFTYGARGQLTRLTNNDHQNIDYRYNHALQRVSKIIGANTQDEHEQHYLWQQGLLDAEIDVKNNQETLTRRYLYVGLRPIAMIDYDADKTPSIYTIHTDHLGTPQQVSNEAQEIVWQGEYDAFGNVTVKAVYQNKTQDVQAKQNSWSLNLINTADAADITTGEIFEFNLRFAGQYEDSESGYYYNWHRYYNPETGRYLTSDPIGLNGGLNTYSYAGANPVSAVDPWGLYSIIDNKYGLINFYTEFDLLPNFSIPLKLIPKWKDYSKTDMFYHKYNMKVTVDGLSKTENNGLQSYLVNHPVPNSKGKPATQDGTYHSASPDSGPFANAAWFVSPDPVYSFIRYGKNKQPFIVNVTTASHSLSFGIVIRGLECKNGKTIIHNYGEGNGFFQSAGVFSDRLLNDVWYWTTEDMLEKVTGRKYKINGKDWTKGIADIPATL